jgi:hypothetical protein
MIIVCDLLCKSMSHEKVNSGFIYGLSLAFPGEAIRFYADASHIEAIKKILVHDQILIENLEFKPIKASINVTMIDVVVGYFILFKIFTEVTKLNLNKIFFLSFSPEILYVIKKLKNIKQFAQLKFTLVLHAGFESIANDACLYPSIILPRAKISPSTKYSLFGKIIRTKPKDLPKKVYHKILSLLPKASWLKRAPVFFDVKRMMESSHSSDYRYIALSPHIVNNAGKYIDLHKFNFYTVILPTNFVKPAAVSSKNEYARFATFGYGDSLVLHNIAYLLAQRNITRPYEIRIIGMDNRGIEGFPNITCTSKGEVLARDEMERQAADIDAFLILYDKARYRLSCSGSMLESLSMIKPIIHFENDCINQFNTIENPIGFCCSSLDEYVSKLVDIIENFDSYRSTFANFRKNILKLREDCAIHKSVPQLRESFSW